MWPALYIWRISSNISYATTYSISLHRSAMSCLKHEKITWGQTQTQRAARSNTTPTSRAVTPWNMWSVRGRRGDSLCCSLVYRCHSLAVIECHTVVRPTIMTPQLGSNKVMTYHSCVTAVSQLCHSRWKHVLDYVAHRLTWWVGLSFQLGRSIINCCPRSEQL